ncbi:MAG: GT4 family glycosyltransferase PelF, partial [Candidatus Omnitrophica bacterium]|nr:GT4 family glycosyltransferase PelF [Candidatus Omnitrophota bacterium]
MNILQILPELNVGGVETGTVDFAKYLTAQGHKSIVVSAGGALAAELEQSGSRHYTLPVHRKNIFTILRCAHALAGIIKAEGIDIVHARSRVPAWAAFLACRRTQAAFVTTCHGYYAPHPLGRPMGWGKRVIAISQVIGRHMVQDFKVPPEFVRVIPRSVDLSKFQIDRAAKPMGAPKMIAMVGRITPLKGHPYFLKAMAQVVRQMPDVKIQIIGDVPAGKKPYKDELILLAKRLGLANHVEFLGNRRDVPQLLSQSDCLVLSTVTQEAFGRVILEAQAAGVPVVATKVGGVVEIIDDGDTGLLVMPKDPGAMAKAVLRLLGDRILAQKIVEQAQKRIDERYTIKHMAEATCEVYKEILQSMHILIVKLTSISLNHFPLILS